MKIGEFIEEVIVAYQIQRNTKSVPIKIELGDNIWYLYSRESNSSISTGVVNFITPYGYVYIYPSSSIPSEDIKVSLRYANDTQSFHYPFYSLINKGQVKITINPLTSQISNNTIVNSTGTTVNAGRLVLPTNIIISNGTSSWQTPTLTEWKPVVASVKTKVCECGKEKHGFARHSNWCELFE